VAVLLHAQRSYQQSCVVTIDGSVAARTKVLPARASAKDFPGGGGATEKRLKNNKKTKNSTIQPLPGGEGQREKTPKNSTIKPLFTRSVPCVKIQGGEPRPPAADAHAYQNCAVTTTA